jgi:hypothetical protein
MPANPTVGATVDGWIRHFASADRELLWMAAEEELSIPLMPGVILAGRVDARGVAMQHGFFGEWKTMARYSASGWREKWRMHPQSLTYGLLLSETHPEIDRFTIRVALKTDPPTFDHEWFNYSAAEVQEWRGEVERIANEIGELIRAGYWAHNPADKWHWPLNPLSCYKWGPKYPCPYVYACSHQEWSQKQPQAPLPYIPHLQVMRDAAAQPTPPLVLDATAITTYLECPESFRRRYIRGEDEPPSEALVFGSQFHAALDNYYKQLVAGSQFATEGAAKWPNH